MRQVVDACQGCIFGAHSDVPGNEQSPLVGPARDGCQNLRRDACIYLDDLGTPVRQRIDLPHGFFRVVDHIDIAHINAADGSLAEEKPRAIDFAVVDALHLHVQPGAASVTQHRGDAVGDEQFRKPVAVMRVGVPQPGGDVFPAGVNHSRPSRRSSPLGNRPDSVAFDDDQSVCEGSAAIAVNEGSPLDSRHTLLGQHRRPCLHGKHANGQNQAPFHNRFVRSR